MDDTNVFFHSANNRITYLGKKANIEEAKQAIKDLTTVVTIERVVVNVQEDIRWWIFEKKAEFKQIEQQTGSQIYVTKEKISIKGTIDSVA